MPVRVFSEKERDELRIKMLEAGFPLLKEYGMTHTSISKITKAAGIGISTFYNFWKTKEEYMTDLIKYYRNKMIPIMVDEEVLTGKRKLKRPDVKKFFLALVDENVSIYPHMNLMDEFKLIGSSDIFKPELDKESSITNKLMEHVDNIREDMNIGLIANLTKILAITSEARSSLHESAYDETIDRIIEMILDEIFKE